MTLLGKKARNHPQQVARDGADDGIDDRRTPAALFARYHERCRFTLDAAASEENHLCPMYYTRERSGLTGSWTGQTVWCNPPFSRIAPWVNKAWHAMLEEGCRAVVMLAPANRTEQPWWQDHIEPYRDGREARVTAIVGGEVFLRTTFLRGRTRFGYGAGVPRPQHDRPPFSIVVLEFQQAYSSGGR